MLADEALFLGHPVAHIVAFYECRRLARIRAQTQAALHGIRRQRGVGTIPA